MDTLFSFIFCTLSGMGLGGGGLFSVYLSVFREFPQFIAQGVNLCTFAVCSVCASLINLRKRNVNYPICLFLSFCACAGAIPGSIMASYMPQRVMKLLFGVFLLTTSVICFCEKRK